jgi:uncharacterized protein (TIGR02246 family)
MKIKIIILLLLTSCVSVFAQTKDDEALKSLVKQMTAAQSAYDAAALDKLLTPDYIEISPVGEVDPREKVLGFYKPELKPPTEKMTAATDATDFTIRNYGKLAVIIVRLNYTITSEGKPLPPRSLRATFVCRTEKSVWRVASAQYTGILSRPTAK